MGLFKKIILSVLSAVLFVPVCAGCNGGSGGDAPSGNVIPTAYQKPRTVTDMDTWASEVVKDGKNNDDAVEDGVVKSPYYQLSINGTSVPVYTARCGESPHSFAWVDVEGAPEKFNLAVKLTTVKKYTDVVVLPEKSKVTASIKDKEITASITAYGDYSFAFGLNNKSPSPINQPLTIYVAPEEKLSIPTGYSEEVIQPGKHSYADTKFEKSNTVYRFKAGDHEINGIKLPSDSILYLERGAYLSAYETGDRYSVIEAVDCENVKVTGRGLIDFSALDGGDDKLKHPSTVARSKNIEYSGLTFINANTWTLCFYASENVTVSRNMLLAYRTYSDGIMMSECRDSTGRYNFVRTGDDAIEVKGTGWWQSVTNSEKIRGENILYEHNSVWTDKGSAYGIIWENEVPLKNVTFRNNSVGFAMPVWNAYNNALDVRLGCDPSVLWEDVTYENIEIYECWPAAITVSVNQRGGQVEDILFKNITVKRSPKGNKAIRIQLNQVGADGDYSEIIRNVGFENISFVGKKLSEADKDDSTLIDFAADNEANRKLITIR